MQQYVRLSQRPPATIRAQGETYRQMAATARTAEAKRSLEALAARLANLADQCEARGSQSASAAVI
jgi:hypothetical protein